MRQQDDDSAWTWIEQHLADQLRRYDRGKGWSRMQEAMVQPDGSAVSSSALTRRSYIWFGTAAAIIVALGLSFSRWHAERGVGREIVTLAGQRTAVTLSNGTQLVLGPSSRLRVMADFDQSARDVQLEGEALLAVVHDVQHPFVVYTARAVVRDVGTTFAVQAYGDDPDTRVAVTEGEVSVAGVALHRQEAVIIDPSGQVTVQHGGDLRPYTGWAQGQFVFDGTPLRDVVRELSRTFDLQITIADTTLAAQHITGTYTSQSVDVILADITSVLGAQYQRTGHIVSIRRGTPRPLDVPLPQIRTTLAK